MKCVLLLLLALPCISLAFNTACNPVCPLLYNPVCGATEARPVYFVNDCFMDYYKCLSGKPMHLVSRKLCEGHAPDEGQKLILALLDKMELSGSDSDENSSSSD